MKEGSTEAPIRHPIAWNDPAFTDMAKIDEELRRVFDICHGCRRCFNLCDSFPRLFDLIDEASTGELDSVNSADFKPVVDACTLCDMCFLTKCPYVPPHEFDLDFPHLMLRYRAAERAAGESNFVQTQLSRTDRNGKLGALVSPLANWASDKDNGLTRPILEAVAGIDKRSSLPKFHTRTFSLKARGTPLEVNRAAPAFGRKAAIYATCFVNYNDPDIGMAARAVLAHNGVETDVVYPACCGMPQLEQGNIAAVAENARKVSTELVKWIDQGFDIVIPIASCALMVKQEWPLILPDDANVQRLAKAAFEIDEYVVDIAKKEGLVAGLQPLEGGVTVHIACHARAQNMGPKAAEMLKLIPGTEVAVIERCSGHGGSWGVLKENHDTALKVGKPVARQAVKNAKAYLASECPLAAKHIREGMEELGATPPGQTHHPIQILAAAYGLV